MVLNFTAVVDDIRIVHIKIVVVVSFFFAELKFSAHVQEQTIELLANI